MPPSHFAQPFRLTKKQILNEHFFILEGVSLWYPELKFLSGQFLMIDGMVNGDYMRRSYSPFRSENGNFGLLIKRNKSGLFSSYLMKQNCGDIIRINAPVGKEKIFSSVLEPVIVLAFGSGISFAKNLTTWGAANISSVLWLDEEVNPADKQTVVSELRLGVPVEYFNTRQEFISDLLEIIKHNPRFYLSGDGQYISFAKHVLRMNNIPDDHIHTEIFFNHKTVPPDDWKAELP